MRPAAPPRHERSGHSRHRQAPARRILTAALSTALAVLLPAALPAAVVPAAAADVPDDAAMYAWGVNDKGQLGDGTGDQRLEPVVVHLPDGVTVTDVAAEPNGTMALSSDGQVYGWGTNQSWQLAIGASVDGDEPIPLDLSQPAGARFTDLAAGYSGQRLALTSDGVVIAWGSDQFGMAGNGDESTWSLYDPVDVDLPSGVHATAVEAGYDTSFAIASTGELYGWGRNDQGQLGDGSTDDRDVPAQVNLPEGTDVLQVAAGRRFTMALTADGDVYSWGTNFYGQLGFGTTDEDPHPTPAKVSMPDDATIAQIAAGSGLVAALSSTGRLFTWGDTGRPSPGSVALPAGTHVRSIDSDGSVVFVLTTDGTLLAWGFNHWGLLGDGSTDSRDTPAAVHLPAGAPITAVAASNNTAFAVTAHFPDVTAANPFAADINWQLRYGITEGFGDGTFRPTAPVTRGQMAVYLYRYAHGGDDAPGCTVPPFSDVPAGSPACGAIAWLKADGVAGGSGDGNFHPTAAVSRQAMAAFLYRYYWQSVDPSHFCWTGFYFNGQWIPFAAAFPDVPNPSTFWCAVSWLKGARPVGITGGYPDGNFHPTAAVSRQTMAAFLHRYFTDYYGYGVA